MDQELAKHGLTKEDVSKYIQSVVAFQITQTGWENWRRLDLFLRKKPSEEKLIKYLESIRKRRHLPTDFFKMIKEEKAIQEVNQGQIFKSNKPER